MSKLNPREWFIKQYGTDVLGERLSMIEYTGSAVITFIERYNNYLNNHVEKPVLMSSELENIVKNASYDSKRKIHSSLFSSCIQTSGKLSNKLDLITLICLVSQKMSADNKTVTPKDVIEKIVVHTLNPNNSYDHYLIGLSIVCEDMMVGVDEISALGCTTSGEIIVKIKQLLAEWLPF